MQAQTELAQQTYEQLRTQYLGGVTDFLGVLAAVTEQQRLQRDLLTSLKRPMMGQSRLIYNVIAEWNKPRLRSNARFYTNYVSRRITDVGAIGLPDIYQESNVFLDAVYQYNFREDGRWSIRFSAENLTDNHYEWTQADILQRSFRLGRTFSVITSYSFF